MSYICKNSVLLSFLKRCFCCFNKNSTKNQSSDIAINYNDAKDFKIISRLINQKGFYHVKSVYDGDTVTISVPILFKCYSLCEHEINSVDLNLNLNESNSNNEICFYDISVRLLGIDTYEIKPKLNILNRDEHIKKAKLAKEYLESLILNKIVFVEFSNSKFDPYSRPLVNIYIDNVNVTELLIKNKHGIYYDGHKKTLI